MADFYQTGVVATLHRRNGGGLERLERQLEEFTRVHPIGLVLPALYSEFETSTMPQIISELAQARYLTRRCRKKAEQHDATQVLNSPNEYFAAILDPTSCNDGLINRIIGDRLTALFGTIHMRGQDITSADLFSG